MALVEDTSLLTRTRSGACPRERIEMTAERDVNLPEHRALGGFLAQLHEETRELLALVDGEIRERLRRRRFFHGRSIRLWQAREEPRLAGLEEARSQASRLLTLLRELPRRHPFLPADRVPARRLPERTKRFTQDSAYSVLYRLMRDHYHDPRRNLDHESLLLEVKSLALLWEYWTVLKVVEFLQRHLHTSAPLKSSGGIFRRLTGRRTGYLVELEKDRRLEFTDEMGKRILFRYQPHYGSLAAAARSHTPRRYGRLRRRGAPLEPDMALEIFGKSDDLVPEQIIILDAKFSSRPHRDLIRSLLHYREIGEFGGGRRLARQIWALTCAPAEAGPGPDPEEGRETALEKAATVDNDLFFSPDFAPEGEVCGALEIHPGQEGTEEPLEQLLRRLLER
jgi:hypothetical protein